MSIHLPGRGSVPLTPREYENAVAAFFRNQGYLVELGPGHGDWGVDAFASKGSERLVVQAKMYGGSSRRINRAMVMQLHGARDYFSCTGAAIVTDGSLAPDATEVAAKLHIRVVHLPAVRSAEPDQSVGEAVDRKATTNDDHASFDSLWARFVVPLAGQTLVGTRGSSNTIVTVDWSGVRRITSNGKVGFIEIESFRWAVEELFQRGFVARAEINERFRNYASSGTILILSQVPHFELTHQPAGLRLRGTKSDKY